MKGLAAQVMLTMPVGHVHPVVLCRKQASRKRYPHRRVRAECNAHEYARTAHDTSQYLPSRAPNTNAS